MSISSNSVIHYTNKLENLKGIIKSQGFRLKYCLEELQVDRKIEFFSAIPMVSFCDIPLSEVKNHIDSYGSYGIGLYKTWAKTMHLNPVLYLESNSLLTKTLLSQFERISALRQTEKEDQQLNLATINTLLYCKNYEGRLKHGKIDDENYRFYDEREWRYVENSETLKDAPFVIWGSQYIEKKDEFNDKLKDIYLKFSFSDISYLIVDDESDIHEILNVLNEVYEDVCTSKELKILSTRIITKNQIYNDF